MDKKDHRGWKFGQVPFSRHYDKVGSNVVIKYLWEASKLTVCPIEDIQNAENLENLIEKTISDNKAIPMDHLPEVDDIVIAKWGTDKSKTIFCRGRVESFVQDETSKVNVHFADCGGENIVNLNELFHPTAEIMKHPIYGAIFNVEDVTRTLSDDQMAKLTRRIGQLEIKHSDRVNGVFSGCLWMGLDTTWKDLIFKITNPPLDWELPWIPSEDPTSSLQIKVKHGHSLSSNLKDGALVQVPFVWNVSKFTINAIADLGSMNGLDKLIEENISDESTVRYIVEPPDVGEIVLAPFEGKYYRAQVKSIRTSSERIPRLLVLFLDFGAEALVTLDELRGTTEAIMEHPIYGIIINVDRLPPDPPGGLYQELKKLKEIAAGEFILQVLNVESELDDFVGQLWLTTGEKPSTWSDKVWSSLAKQKVST